VGNETKGGICDGNRIDEMARTSLNTKRLAHDMGEEEPHQIDLVSWPLVCLVSGGQVSTWEGEVSMGTSWGSRVIGALVAMALAAGLATAQQSSVEDGKRKIKYKVNPQYSEIARKLSLAGKVKIELVIAPDGHVKTARPVGGHPVLVQSCLEVVKDWKFEPAQEETTQIIEIEFKP
jgi:TonB family protein